MDSYIESAATFYRVFTDPSKFAKESVRDKAVPTFTWVVSYSVILLTASYALEKKDVDATGRGVLISLWIASAFCGAFVFKKWSRLLEITYGETALLYMIWLAVLMTCDTAGRLFMPHGAEPDGLLASIPFIVIMYFTVIPIPKMLKALTEGSDDYFRVCIQFYFAFLGSMIILTGIAVFLTPMIGSDVPIGDILRKIP